MTLRTSSGPACGLGLLSLSALAGGGIPPEDVVERLVVTAAFITAGVMFLADARRRRQKEGSRR